MNKLSIVGFLFSISALALSIFQYQHFLQVHPVIEAQLKKEANQLQVMNQALMSLENKVASIPQTVPVVSMTALSELKAMIQLSVLQLEYAKNPKAASQLLTLVDKKIEESHDLKWMPLREAVIHDRLALESVEVPDIEGLWLQLSALITEVEKFPHHWTALNRQNEEQQAEDLKPTKAWEKGWYELKDLVRIQHHDNTIQPMLSLDEQALVTQHLQLLLEQARWAVLNLKPLVYQASIQESMQWLKRYFDNNDTGVDNAIQTLKKLETIQLEIVLPNLDRTLNQLSQLDQLEK